MSIALIPNNSNDGVAVTDDGVRIDGYVTVALNGEVITEKHNVMTANGLDLIRTHLTTGSTQYPVNITVGSGASPGSASTTLDGIITDTGLVADGACTIGTTTTGNWTCHFTFTATGTKNNVNTTALYTADATMFAGANFSSTNLANNDQLTVNWTITAS